MKLELITYTQNHSSVNGAGMQPQPLGPQRFYGITIPLADAQVVDVDYRAESLRDLQLDGWQPDAVVWTDRGLHLVRLGPQDPLHVPGHFGTQWADRVYHEASLADGYWTMRALSRDGSRQRSAHALTRRAQDFCGTWNDLAEAAFKVQRLFGTKADAAEITDKINQTLGGSP